MNAGHTRPGSLRPGFTRLPDGRGRMVVFAEKLSNGEQFRADLRLAKGTLYSTAEKVECTGRTAHLAGLRLVDDGTQQAADGWYYVRTYEDIHASNETQVGGVQINVGPNGLGEVVLEYVQFTTGARTVGDAGTSTCPAAGYTSYLLATEEAPDDGTVRRIRRRYLQPGLLSQTDNYANNGALHVRSLTTFGVVPTTPEGFVFIGSQASEVEGIPTRTYRFAKGTGEIDRSTSTSNNGALTRVTIRHLTAPDGTDPLASLSGYVRIAHSKAEADGHRVWTATFAAGTGTVSVSESPGPVAGTLSVRTVALTAPGASQPSVSGVLVDRDKREADGHLVWTLTAVTGTITGTKLSYSAPYEVRTPGTVALTTVAVTAGDLSGTIAVANVTPPRTKTVAATVTLEITTSPPSTTTLAYDLGAISCSVTATSASYNFTGYDEGRTDSGDVRMSYPRRSASISANIQTFPNCYLSSGTSASGSFVYNAGAQYSLSSGGTILTETVRTSTEVNTLTGNGATSATGYATTGVLERKSRPVFTALDGTIYYEVITWSV